MAKINKNFIILDENHKRLKTFAAIHGVTLGEAIGLLLDLAGVKVAPPGSTYREYLINMIAVGDKYGDAAAQAYLKEHPYEG